MATAHAVGPRVNSDQNSNTDGRADLAMDLENSSTFARMLLSFLIVERVSTQIYSLVVMEICTLLDNERPEYHRVALSVSSSGEFRAHSTGNQARSARAEGGTTLGEAAWFVDESKRNSHCTCWAQRSALAQHHRMNRIKSFVNSTPRSVRTIARGPRLKLFGKKSRHNASGSRAMWLKFVRGLACAYAEPQISSRLTSCANVDALLELPRGPGTFPEGAR
eukprot:6173626-Pleurochrysis_carterae.AAC.1